MVVMKQWGISEWAVEVFWHVCADVYSSTILKTALIMKQAVMGREQTIAQLLTRQLRSWERSRAQWQGQWKGFSSGLGQSRMGHMSHLFPAPLPTRLVLVQVSGWNHQDPSTMNQRKGIISLAHRLFHPLFKVWWQPGWEWEPPLSPTVMVSQCTSTQYYFNTYVKVKKKIDRLHIRKYFYNYLYAYMYI